MIFAALGITADTPGCAVGIAEGGQTVYAKGFGLANLGTKAPMTPTTLVHVDSVSKQFTAAAILLLAQESRLSLGDDVRQYIPELPEYDEPITLQDLIWMESGLGDMSALFETSSLTASDRLTGKDILGLIAKIHSLDFAPGSQFEYSGMSYFLLRVVMERVTGGSLAAFAKARIFGPLGMTASSFRDGLGTASPGDATSYDLVSSSAATVAEGAWDVQGPAGLRTNVQDLVRWAGNFVSGVVGGPAFLQAQLIGGPRPPDAFPLQQAAYAAGFFVGTYQGRPVILQPGLWPTFRSELLIAPADHLAVALTCNAESIADPTQVTLDVLDAWLGR